MLNSQNDKINNKVNKVNIYIFSHRNKMGYYSKSCISFALILKSLFFSININFLHLL